MGTRQLVHCAGHQLNWAAAQENRSSGFPTKCNSNQPAQLQRLAKKFEFSLLSSLDLILSNKLITKVLIRLRGCAGWSAPLLFANP